MEKMERFHDRSSVEIDSKMWINKIDDNTFAAIAYSLQFIIIILVLFFFFFVSFDHDFHAHAHFVQLSN